LAGEEPLSVYLQSETFLSGRDVGIYLLTALAVVILIMLIALVEMVTLQLLRWGNTRQAMRASLAMNLASSVIWILLLVLFSHPNLGNLLIAWVILVAIEGGVLILLRPQAPRYNMFVAAIANLASYLILILPAFLFRG